MSYEYQVSDSDTVKILKALGFKGDFKNPSLDFAASSNLLLLSAVVGNRTAKIATLTDGTLKFAVTIKGSEQEITTIHPAEYVTRSKQNINDQGDLIGKAVVKCLPPDETELQIKKLRSRARIALGIVRGIMAPIHQTVYEPTFETYKASIVTPKSRDPQPVTPYLIKKWSTEFGSLAFK